MVSLDDLQIFIQFLGTYYLACKLLTPPSHNVQVLIVVEL